MGTRELASLLRVLRAAGVTSYTTPDLSLQFGDLEQQQPIAAAGAPDAESAAEPLDLPDGTPDPVEMLRRINARRATSS